MHGQLTVRRVAAVRHTEDCDPIRGHRIALGQPLGSTADVDLFHAAPVVPDAISELPSPAGRTAVVRIEHGVPLVHEELRVAIEPPLRPGGRSAVNLHDRGTRLFAGFVQQRADLQSVRRLVGNVLRGDERRRVDVAVLRGQHRLYSVRVEIVTDDLAALRPRLVGAKQPASPDEPAVAAPDRAGYTFSEVEFPTLVGCEVVYYGHGRGLASTERDGPFPVGRNAHGFFDGSTVAQPGDGVLAEIVHAHSVEIGRVVADRRLGSSLADVESARFAPVGIDDVDVAVLGVVGLVGRVGDRLAVGVERYVPADDRAIVGG